MHRISPATDGVASAQQEIYLANGIKVHIEEIITGDQGRGNTGKVFGMSEAGLFTGSEGLMLLEGNVSFT